MESILYRIYAPWHWQSRAWCICGDDFKDVIQTRKIDEYENACTHVKFTEVHGQTLAKSIDYWTVNDFGIARNEVLTGSYTEEGGYMFETAKLNLTHNTNVCYAMRLTFWTPGTLDWDWVKPLGGRGELPTADDLRRCFWYFAQHNISSDAVLSTWRSLLPNATISCDGYLSEEPQILCGSNPYSSISELITMGSPELRSQEFRDGLKKCYIDCCGKLKLTSNNIDNFRSLLSIARNIKKPTKLLQEARERLSRDLASGASDAWLKYRYVYSTTKSDIDDAVSKLDQLSPLAGDKYVVRTAVPELVNLHVKLYAEEDLSSFNDKDILSMSLKKIGLFPDAYNLWDLVPFSFVIDWFVPIGDAFESLQSNDWIKSMPYRVSCLYSVKGVGMTDFCKFEFYLREQYDPDIAQFDTEAVEGSHKAKTWIKRGLDVIAMMKGG